MLCDSEFCNALAAFKRSANSRAGFGSGRSRSSSMKTQEATWGVRAEYRKNKFSPTSKRRPTHHLPSNSSQVETPGLVLVRPTSYLRDFNIDKSLEILFGCINIAYGSVFVRALLDAQLHQDLISSYQVSNLDRKMRPLDENTEQYRA
jgi:hypothetical protein